MAEPGLRARKKERTRQLLAETARRMFVEHGFENVSIAEISRVADVAEGTVFNYFPTKEDLVFGNLEVFEGDLLQAIAERPRGETILEAFGRFIIEPRGLLSSRDEERARELVAFSRMIAESPSLLAYEQGVFERYTQALADLLRKETGAKRSDLEPYVVANALISVHRALIAYVRERLREPTLDRRALARDVRTRGRAALALLVGGLGGYNVTK
jgi:AcrR family transcriptional regulator